MYDSREVGKVLVEFAIDETIPGRHPKCAACHTTLLSKDERIVIRRDTVNVQGIREGVFLCFSCALDVASTIRRLLGYEE